MRSGLMEEVRAERRRIESSLSVEERITRAIAMGEVEVGVYCSTHPGTTPAQARAVFARARQHGRRTSGCMVRRLEGEP